MIAKLPKKDIIGILYLTFFVVTALVYGFAAIPTPALQRDNNFDKQRVSDLEMMKYDILDYHAQFQTLPNSLNDLAQNNYAPSSKLQRNDPETGNPYEYGILADARPRFKLCATFKTDSADTEKYDDSRYYNQDFMHKKGYQCFSFYTPTLSPIPSVGVQIRDFNNPTATDPGTAN